ncbi:MAG: hypothetical protein QGH42_05570 [Kiritimatiellia bacterium]|nr:hypothetical protein [Kiritimatiellia bacterium]MDP6630115.1 hypothetical protein [Kiritimatiellia bacterium]MDP6810616.1 hypothetical protein [Kiritimatiellia bacterium]MDP7023701.1 hypothetical protein [Kiritimatiellia bacterium]
MMDRRMQPWNEWKERCAVLRCSPETRLALHTFGGQRYRTLAQRCLSTINVSDVVLVALPDADAWHLLELHMTLPEAINGKAYKEWLFARVEGASDAPFDIVQGGATLLMRSVVREHLRREYLSAAHISTHQGPPGTHPTEDATEEWLPGTLDTAEAVETEELALLAAKHAATLFEDLPRRQRIALAARHLHIPLSNARLLAVAGCLRSALHGAFREFAEHVLDYVRDHFPRDDRDTQRDLALALFERISHLCASWAETDYHCRTALSAQHPAPQILGTTA